MHIPGTKLHKLTAVLVQPRHYHVLIVKTALFSHNFNTNILLLPSPLQIPPHLVPAPTDRTPTAMERSLASWLCCAQQQRAKPAGRAGCTNMKETAREHAAMHQINAPKPRVVRTSISRETPVRRKTHHYCPRCAKQY